MRGLALGMRVSDELETAAAAVYEEMQRFGIEPLRFGIGIFDDGLQSFDVWLTTVEANGDSTDMRGNVALTEHPMLIGLATARRRGESDFSQVLLGNEVAEYTRYIAEAFGIPLPEGTATSPDAIPASEAYHCVYFSHGFLYVVTTQALPEERAGIMRRFAPVFELAYTRFLDLQQAESRTRLALRQGAVHRVQAHIATMRTGRDLEDITSLIWTQLSDLGVAFFRCGIFIVDETDSVVRIYLTNKSGVSLAELTLHFDSHPLITSIVEHWRTDSIHVEDWDRAQFVQWLGFLQQQAEHIDAEHYTDAEAPPERLVLHIVPFSQGMLYVGSTERLPDEDVALIGDLAGAFSVAYARFLDFQQLEHQKTQLEEANLELAEANERVQLETLNKSKFLSRMSHDLRTPMNAIIGYTRILKRRSRDVLDERQLRNLANIQTSADNLLGLINEVLDLSRIEAGRIELHPEPVDLRHLMAQCIASVAPLARPGVELVEDLDTFAPLETDPERLRRIVMNLLGNAVKFTDAGCITVSLHVAGDGCDVAVADTGVGIPPEDLPHIFEEFHQVERTVGTKREGTGLGLAIAQRSAHLLGGHIEAVSQIGEGSVFTLHVGNCPQ